MFSVLFFTAYKLFVRPRVTNEEATNLSNHIFVEAWRLFPQNVISIAINGEQTDEQYSAIASYYKNFINTKADFFLFKSLIKLRIEGEEVDPSMYKHMLNLAFIDALLAFCTILYYQI